MKLFLFLINVFTFLTTVNARPISITVYNSYLGEYIPDVEVFDINHNLLGKTSTSGYLEINAEHTITFVHPNFEALEYKIGNIMNLKLELILTNKQKQLLDSTDLINQFIDTNSICHDTNMQNAEYKGGITELYHKISKELTIPEFLIEHEISGKIYIDFIVEKDGSVNYCKIIKGLNRSIDNQIIKLIKSIQFSKPAMLNGEAVRTLYKLPITIQID